MKCYASQFYDPNSTEPETPISGKEFFDVLESKARILGRYLFTDYAEGFITNRVIGVPGYAINVETGERLNIIFNQCLIY